MKRRFLFDLAYEVDEFTKKDIEELNGLLSKVGMSVSHEKRKDNYRILIECDTDEFDKKTKRGAGQKQKYLNKSVKVEDIRERMKTESAETIAKDLGVSRATLFRKLKDAEKWEDDYIF